jgi:hypothetical protein
MFREVCKFIRQLLCKHNWIDAGKRPIMLHGGMSKMVLKGCTKCGKEKTFII